LPAIGIMKQAQNRFMKVAAVCWLSVVVGAMAALLHYSTTSGPTGAIPDRWPAGSRISFDARRPNLVLFAHPRCPCTRATLGELELLMARYQGRVNAQVWFITPEGAGPDWKDSALWRKAASIPGIAVHHDEGMAEAARFGAGTSGQTLLYDGDGRLLFQGGITLSRGHAGENPGSDALVALLEHRKFPVEIQTPVFGCPLFSTRCQEGEIACKP